MYTQLTHPTLSQPARPIVKLSDVPLVLRINLAHPELRNERILCGWKEGAGPIGEFVEVTIRATHRSMQLQRDLLGVRPLYYSVIGPNCVLVSTSLFSLGQIHQPRLPNENFISKILSGDHSDLENTPLQKVYRVIPGGSITLHYQVDTHCITRDPIEEAHRPAIPYEESKVEWFNPLVCSLTKSVMTRVDKNRKPALLLSGGLDSSLLAVLANRCGVDHLRTLTLNFPNPPERNLHLNYILETTALPHEQINYQDVGLAQLLPIDPEFHRYCMYSPGLMIFDVLLKRAAELGHDTVWTGLGGDDVFSLNDSIWADFPIAHVPYRKLAKRVFYRLPHKYRAYLGKSIPLGTAGTDLTAVQECLLRRFYYNGAYPFGIEIEQELAQRHGLWMSYPLLDHSLIEFVCRQKPFIDGTQVSHFDKYFLRIVASLWISKKSAHAKNDQTYENLFRSAYDHLDSVTQFRERTEKIIKSRHKSSLHSDPLRYYAYLHGF